MKFNKVTSFIIYLYQQPGRIIMSSNQYKEQRSGHENVIVFQNITQREDADSTILSNQPEAALPDKDHASSIKMRYLGQGASQRKWLLFISISLLVVIVLLGILVLRGDRTKSTELQTAATTQGKDTNQPGSLAESKDQTRPDTENKNANNKPIPSTPVTVVPPAQQTQPQPKSKPEPKPTTPTIRPQESIPPQQPTPATIRPQERIPPQQPKPVTDLQIEKVSLEKVTLPIEVPAISAPGHSPSSQHKHNDLIFDYPTLGMPIPGRKYNDTKVSPQDLPLFDQTFNDLFKPYNDTDCEFVRYGKIDDGGYVLCKNFFTKSHALLNIGVNGQDSFGCDVTAAHLMPNYQYDCTNGNAPVCSKNKGLNYFSNVCVGSKTQKTQFHTFHSYEDILRSHNLTDKHITLKIDCEGGEYPGFKALPLKYLDLIDQIIIEIHLDTIYYEEWGMLDIFKAIADKFVSVNYHNNNWGCFQGAMRQSRKLKSRAPELTLVNKNLIKLRSESRSFAMHPLNQKNGRQVPDCQMDV